MNKERIVCPNCGASYRVTVKMLQQAGQEARCAVCKEVFTINVQDIEFSPDNPEFSPENVIRQLRASEQRENQQSEQAKSETTAAPPAGPQQAESAKKAPGFSVTPAQKMPPAAPRVAAGEAPVNKERKPPAVAAGKTAPSDESAHHRILSAEAGRERQPMVLWLAGSVVLALALLSQTAWLMRDNPFVYRNIATLCSLMGCNPPELRNPKAISIADRLFTAVEDEPGTYQLRLNIRNHAPYPQPLPTIELSLLDSNGVVQARNRFAVEQYLAEQDERILQPNQDTAVAFTVHSPAADTTGFMLDFL